MITSPFTFFGTAGTIARAGARPVFCDIDPVNFNLSPEAVATFLADDCEHRSGAVIHTATGGRVKALMPVHLYGQAADMDALMRLARDYQLRVIEDAAQAIGAEDAHQKRACSFGDVGCLSFFPTKNLGSFGDAGMCVTNDPALAERMDILRVTGGKPKYYHSFIGGNFRIDELQAAVLNVKLNTSIPGRRGGSVTPSSIRFHCICRSVSSIWVISRATFRIPREQPRKHWRCQFFRS